MSARVAKLPVVQPERRERLLRAAWAEEDELAAKLKEARARSRVLEREVGRERGCFGIMRREHLERMLGG